MGKKLKSVKLYASTLLKLTNQDPKFLSLGLQLGRVEGVAPLSVAGAGFILADSSSSSALQVAVEVSDLQLGLRTGQLDSLN